MENIIAFRTGKNKPLKITELLRLYRTRSHLTQSELAKRLTLQSDRMVRKWETGHSLPEPVRLKKLIEVYLREGIFIKGHEREEVQTLWAVVKAAFELQSRDFETYNIFDAGWFDALNLEITSTTGAAVEIKPPEATAHPGLMATRHNLPFQLTRLIGREKEVGQIEAVLDSSRLLTLTGPGGTGKSRLAVEVSFNLIENFKGGVRLVNLDTLPHPEFLLEAIARAVLVGDDSGPARSVEELIEYLVSKELLLVLDNCDNILPQGGILLDRLLKGCPGLTVLATSRENLNIGGETIFQVRPLSLPGLEDPDHPKLEEALGSAAVRLFIERAEAVQPGFNPGITRQDYLAIGRICRQLDGLPLAIELAASLIEGLSVEQIDARLADPFALLKTGRSNWTGGPAHRHSGLESCFDWSYVRLKPGEQLMLQLLGNMAGSDRFSLEMIEQKYREAGNEASQALDLVNSLVKKSLVEVHINPADETVSFSLLETVRKYSHKHPGGNHGQFSQ